MQIDAYFSQSSLNFADLAIFAGASSNYVIVKYVIVVTSVKPNALLRNFFRIRILYERIFLDFYLRVLIRSKFF